MKITIPDCAHKNAIAAVRTIQNVLNAITGDTVCAQQHRDIILAHYTRIVSFTNKAIRYGMLERISGGQGKPSKHRKTHSLPEFEIYEKSMPISTGRPAKPKAATDSAHAWNRSPRKPSQRKAKAASEERQVEIYASAKQRANAAKSSAKQGDGSVLKPKFNHDISEPSERKNYALHERYQPSRMNIMNEIEDKGGYKHYMRQPKTESRVFSKGRY